MNEQNAPRVYGVRVGLVAALFSIAQALLLYASALGGYAAIRAMQQAVNIFNTSGPVVDFTLLFPGLIPPLLVTYGSMLVAGVVTAWLAWHAGRLAAIRAGRHAGGARAGMWVWLVSSAVWIVASITVVAITHMDGTISGIFTGTGKPEFMGQEITFLVAQEVIVALIGLGVCAFTGARGAAGATLVEPEPAPIPAAFAPYPFAVYPAPWGIMPPPGYQPGYRPGPPAGAPSPAGLPPYPGAVYPPQPAWTPPPGVYPPPPSHYLPQQPAPQAPLAPALQPPATASEQPPAPGV